MSSQPAALVSPSLYAFLTLYGDQFTPSSVKDDAHNFKSERMSQKTVPGQSLEETQLLTTQEDRILSM